LATKGRNGILAGILGILTLLAAFNVINALIQLDGSGPTVSFRIFNLALGSLQVDTYFWLSAIGTVVLFCATAMVVDRGLPADPNVLWRLSKLEENLANNSSMLENTQIGFFKKLEDAQKTQDEASHRISASLDEFKNDTTDSLAKQKKVIQAIEEDSNKNTLAIEKQDAHISGLKEQLQKMEKETITPKAKLNSLSKLDEFKSISTRLLHKLNEMNVTNIGELLEPDAQLIAEKTSEMVETIANIQSVAQLLMVPSIDEKHAELLVKAGITSRKDLANQDPVKLYKDVAVIAKTHVEEGKLSSRKVPTIEDIDLWIRHAHL
jgi:hypothetical protein